MLLSENWSLETKSVKPVATTLDAAFVLSSSRNGASFPKWQEAGWWSLHLESSLLFSFFPGHNVGNLFHMADDLGRAMESLVSVMTDEEGAE